MATEIASLFAKIGADIGGFENGLKKAEGGLDNLKTNLVALGSTAAKAFAAAGVAVAAGTTAALVGAFNATKDWANQLDSLSDVLGTTAQESAALAVLFEGVGGNVDNLTGQLTFFARGLETAKGELGPVGEELKKLGISAYEIGPLVQKFGQALPQKELDAIAKKLETAGARLSDMEEIFNATRNPSLQMQISLRNQRNEVAELTTQYAKGSEQIGQWVHELGPLKDAPTLLGELADQFSAMPDGIQKSAQMTRIFGRSGRDLSDVMNALAKGGLAEADKKAQALGLSLSDKTVASAIDADRKFALLNQTLRGFGTQIGTILLPLVVPAIDAVAKGLGAMSQAFNEVLAVLGGKFNSMLGRFNELMGKGNASGAIAEFTSGLMNMIGIGGEAANQIGNIVGNLAVGDWQAALDTGLQPLIDSLSSWVEKSLPGMMQGLGKAFGELWLWLFTVALPAVTLWAAEMANRFLAWLIDVNPRVYQLIGDFLLAAGNAILDGWEANVAPQLQAGLESMLKWGAKIGQALVDGIKAGIDSMAEQFTTWLTNFFKGLIKQVQGTLGIGSPSKEFALIGKASMEGYRLGFENAARRSPIDVAGSLTAGASPSGNSQTVNATFVSMLPYDMLQARRQLRGLVR